MDTQFKVGDVVRLKSGGPDMTIGTIEPGQPKFASCRWFDGKKLKQSTFPLDLLVLVPK